MIRDSSVRVPGSWSQRELGPCVSQIVYVGKFLAASPGGWGWKLEAGEDSVAVKAEFLFWLGYL